MKKSERKVIEENIKWFRKFSLEERLRISETDSKSIETFRKLKITKHAKPD